MAPRLDTPALHRPRGDTGPAPLDHIAESIIHIIYLWIELEAGYIADTEESAEESDSDLS